MTTESASQQPLWPTEPDPGYWGDPLADASLGWPMQVRRGGPDLGPVAISPGEPLTRICGWCYRVAGQHDRHCPKRESS